MSCERREEGRGIISTVIFLCVSSERREEVREYVEGEWVTVCIFQIKNIQVTFFLVGKIRRKQAVTNALSAMVTNRMM